MVFLCFLVSLHSYLLVCSLLNVLLSFHLSNWNSLPIVFLYYIFIFKGLKLPIWAAGIVISVSGLVFLLSVTHDFFIFIRCLNVYIEPDYIQNVRFFCAFAQDNMVFSMRWLDPCKQYMCKMGPECPNTLLNSYSKSSMLHIDHFR